MVTGLLAEDGYVLDLQDRRGDLGRYRPEEVCRQPSYGQDVRAPGLIGISGAPQIQSWEALNERFNPLHQS